MFDALHGEPARPARRSGPISIAVKLFTLRQPGILAEPWRRLLAATIDTTLLLSLHIAVIGHLICRCGLNDGSSIPIKVMSPIACWLYVFAGWSLGATLGMRIAGIKLVTESLERVNGLTALKRLAGFALACLPVKAGLLPILFDERRQGWHDRIACTLVVKDTFTKADSIPIRSPSPVLPKAPEPDLRVPLGAAWIALPVYALLTVLMTWPTVLHMSTRVMGVPSDPYIFIWNYWYFLHALQSHQSPLQTDMIFFPHVVSLSLHTMQWFNCILAAPLQRWLNLIAIYNLLNLVSCTASAFCAYWCVAAITRNRVSALVTGALYGLSPYFQAHALGHANLIAAEFLPLYALCAYAALTIHRLRYAIWAGLWMGMAGLCDLQYVAFAALFGVVLLVALWLFHERPDLARLMQRIGLILAGFGVAAIVLLPIIGPAIGQMHARSTDKSRISGNFPIEPADWVMPGVGSRLFGRRLSADVLVEKCVTPGYTFLLLGFIGAVVRWKYARPWCFVGLCFVVLSAGPYLLIHGVGLLPVPYLIAGFPGIGFGLPWETGYLSRLAFTAVSSPGQVLSTSTGFEMPFFWLPSLIPLLKPFRVPARFDVIVLLCVAILASTGLSSLLDGMKRRHLSNMLVALICMSVVCEYYCCPYPSFTPPSYPFFEALGRQRGHFALIEQPLVGDELSAYGQTLHHKPLFKSFISRPPAGAMHTVHELFDDRGAFRSLDTLRHDGARYVVFLLDGKVHATQQDRRQFELAIKARPSYADANMKVYRIDELSEPPSHPRASP